MPYDQTNPEPPRSNGYPLFGSNDGGPLDLPQLDRNVHIELCETEHTIDPADYDDDDFDNGIFDLRDYVKTYVDDNFDDLFSYTLETTGWNRWGRTHEMRSKSLATLLAHLADHYVVDDERPLHEDLGHDQRAARTLNALAYAKDEVIQYLLEREAERYDK